jgi:hypothetical protein
MGKEWPDLLRFLSEVLGYRVRSGIPSLGHETFRVDLTSWKLQLSDQTLVIWVKETDLAGRSSLDLIQSLQDVNRLNEAERQVSLVLLDCDSQAFQPYMASPLYSFVFINREEQEAIIRSRRPSGHLLRLVSAQVPISNLAPYETVAPVTGSRFFGREDEKKRILKSPDTNFVLLGIRRIGKTSLLREIEHILRTGSEDQAPGRILYLDCSDFSGTEDYVREVVRKLNPIELPRLHLQRYAFFFPDFLERMTRKYRGKLVFLLDEIDNLLLLQRGSWDLLAMLRASANKGACQYVIAGFREAFREQTDLDSPFYKFAQEIPLSEFSRAQARDLIVDPMQNLGVRFLHQDEVIGQIYDETAGHPNLLQYYCMILLRQLDRSGEREIGPRSLLNIYLDEGLRTHMISTFLENTTKREQALVYALMADLGEDNSSRTFPQAYIDASLRKRNLRFTFDEIESACNALRLAGVFHRKGRDYSFLSPVFTKILRSNYDPLYLLKKIKEDGL